MDVSLDVWPKVPLRSQIGHVIVDHHIHLLNVDTSSDDIGCDEDFGLPVPEAVKDIVSLLCHLVSVERSDRMTFVLESRSDAVRCLLALFRCDNQQKRASTFYKGTHSTENDALTDGHAVIKGRQSIVLRILAVAFEVELLDRFDRHLFLLQEDLVGFWSE